MQPIYLILIVLWLILIMAMCSRRNAIAQKVIRNKKTGDVTDMVELAKRFIGKECLICAFDGNHQYEGRITEVSSTALLLEHKGRSEAINLDFVIRISEHPTNKKGRKKAFVAD